MAREEDGRAELAHFFQFRAVTQVLGGQSTLGFLHFVTALMYHPSHKKKMNEIFLEGLNAWSKDMQDPEWTSVLLSDYEEACDLFKFTNVVMSSEIGPQLPRFGYAEEAISCLREVPQSSPGFCVARQILDLLLTQLVPGWHLAMLNDKRRNTVYQLAIEKAVKQGHDVVLDIGSGTGLLSMFAVKAGASQVYGCEMSETMYQLSRDIVRANNLDESLKLIHCKSTSLQIPDDIPTRVALVVTETFDAGLFGEKVLSTLSHAWEQLLNNEEGTKARVIPGGASVYITAIESESIRKDNGVRHVPLAYLETKDANFFSEVSGLMQDELRQSPDGDSPCSSSDTDGFFSEDSGLMQGELRQSPDGDSPCSSSDTDGAEKYYPYGSEKLADLPGGYQLLTDTTKAIDINFNNVQTISSFLTGYVQDLTLQVTHPGRLDALVVWFDLHLDEDLTLSTAPEADSCWDQAIFPVRITGDQAAHVQRGDQLGVQCSITNDSFEITVTAITPQPQSMSCSETGTPEGSQQQQVDDGCGPVFAADVDRRASVDCTSTLYPSGPIFRLNNQEIKLINALGWSEAYCAAVGAVQDERLDMLNVLDMMKDTGLLPVQLAKMGVRQVGITSANPRKEAMLRHLAKTNGIENDRLQLLTKTSSYEKDRRKWDVLVTELVVSWGLMRFGVLEELAFRRTLDLKPGGVVIPRAARAIGMLVESASLRKISRVSNENVAGLKVADHINQFQIKTHHGIELSSLDYKKLSEPFELLRFRFNDNVPDETPPPFLDQTVSHHVTACDTGRVTAVVYWFELDLVQGVELCTQDHHWRQAAVMQWSDLEVSPGSQLLATTCCRHSCIHVTLQPAEEEVGEAD